MGNLPNNGVPTRTVQILLTFDRKEKRQSRDDGRKKVWHVTGRMAMSTARGITFSFVYNGDYRNPALSKGTRESEKLRPELKQAAFRRLCHAMGRLSKKLDGLSNVELNKSYTTELVEVDYSAGESF